MPSCGNPANYGLASHPGGGGSRNNPGRFMLRKPDGLLSLKTEFSFKTLNLVNLTFPVDFFRTAVEYRKLIGHSGPVFSTSFNNDNSFLLSSSADRTGDLLNHIFLLFMSFLRHEPCFRTHILVALCSRQVCPLDSSKLTSNLSFLAFCFFVRLFVCLFFFLNMSGVFQPYLKELRRDVLSRLFDGLNYG